MKLYRCYYMLFALSRSREGAWIEICAHAIITQIQMSRSREGAWIEIEEFLNAYPPNIESLP